jgi:hypothetical protein
MSLYAEIKNGFVTNIIVAEQDFINALDGVYVEYTTDAPVIGYSASIGFIYDSISNAFIAPQCHNEAVLDEVTRRWNCTNAGHNDYFL